MNPKTVIILGAGASRASKFELPTMAGFFDPGLGRKADLQRFLARLYPARHPGDYNLEEVLAFVDLSRSRLSLWGISDRLSGAEFEAAFRDLLDFVEERLTIPEGAVCDLHADLLKRLSDQDTVITFNYDLIVDQSLLEVEGKTDGGRIRSGSRMGKLPGLIGSPTFWGHAPPSLFPSETDSGHYLKLHGSLDWLYCPNSDCKNNRDVFSRSATPESAAGQQPGAPCRLCGSGLVTLIVPPVATKRLEDRGRLALQWNLALRELVAAEELWLIGLSFAPSDFELKWLLGATLYTRPKLPLTVRIVNPDPSHRTAARNLTSGEDVSFEEFTGIQELLKQMPV